MSLEAIQQALEKYLRTDDLHAAANVVVEARSEYFLTADGSPDYGGRSYAYRQWYGSVVDTLNLSDSDRRKLLGNMRFHVGNALREALSPEELREAGLLVESPVKRGKRNYENRSAPYRVVTSHTKLSSEEEIHKVSELIEKLSRRLDPSEMAESSRSELEKAVRHLLSRVTH